MPTAAEIKKALMAAGLEVYRTKGDVVHLAERVRENLLMDSGIFIQSSEPRVGFVVRAQRIDFPSEGPEALFERARNLAASALASGYREVSAEVREIFDPGDGERVLDTWYEVQFEKSVGDITAAIEEARFALSIKKSAQPY